MNERIFELTLYIKEPNLPFKFNKQISTSSGDLVQVFATFQIQLVQLLKELHEEELNELRMGNDNIPF